ncbi:5'-AMP-activated protein kinase, regulatory beta subunit [Marchantia polymorpha subsp. ruderalis]|uniref:Association with the SNF1 complex (ASC) domain-containing protein n=2 Tax=Marchantia polymorpha TaxID=3197 RepID=A0AAF6BBL4_MARPO|nr:hypothetical protein MARPO_0126s0046 [Marchantia polymorpha]BBN09398.1 hypothetical protein Mp_4g19480 [Marchantia polymorpha subsp. ruderalis]|eukprot:PTQ30344.1 hypothetical protein MARPO_0126s0046 [Marchantia polymorpha]
MEFCSAGVVAQPGTIAEDTEPIWTAEDLAEKMRLDGVPVTFNWKHAGSNIQLWGSWDNWSTRRTMLHDEYGCYLVLILLPGRYEYYYVLDRNCTYPDELYLNNHHELEVFEREERRFGEAFLSTRPAILNQGPESPRSSYTSDFFTYEDFEKEPPLLPPHLSTTVLNATHLEGEPSVIPPPHYATINHMFRDISAHKIPGQGLCACLGFTHRFRSKYVSMVLYKPEFEGQDVGSIV